MHAAAEAEAAASSCSSLLRRARAGQFAGCSSSHCIGIAQAQQQQQQQQSSTSRFTSQPTAAPGSANAPAQRDTPKVPQQAQAPQRLPVRPSGQAAQPGIELQIQRVQASRVRHTGRKLLQIVHLQVEVLQLHSGWRKGGPPGGIVSQHTGAASSSWRATAAASGQWLGLGSAARVGTHWANRRLQACMRLPGPCNTARRYRPVSRAAAQRRVRPGKTGCRQPRPPQWHGSSRLAPGR